MTLWHLFLGPPERAPVARHLPGHAGEVLLALRGVIDPEVGRDVVALGLIRGVEVEDGRANIRMTLTTPGCPLADLLTGAVEEATASLGLEPRVELVFDPPWDPEDVEV